MPPSNMDRKHNKRELDRAKGSIAWTVQHLQVVYGTFYEASISLAEQELDVPDSYVSTMTALQSVTDALVTIGETIQAINDTI